MPGTIVSISRQDYVLGKQAMIEYIASVQNAKSVAQSFVRANAEQLEQVRRDTEPILQSVRLP